MLPPELETHYEQLRERALQGREDRSTASTILQRQGLWAWMMAIAAEEVHAKDRLASATGNTSTALSSRPRTPSASDWGELLAAWTDLLVGVVTRREATS